MKLNQWKWKHSIKFNLHSISHNNITLPVQFFQTDPLAVSASGWLSFTSQNLNIGCFLPCPGIFSLEKPNSREVLCPHQGQWSLWLLSSASLTSVTKAATQQAVCVLLQRSGAPTHSLTCRKECQK